jgi:hypothetical protein
MDWMYDSGGECAFTCLLRIGTDRTRLETTNASRTNAFEDPYVAFEAGL